MNCETCGSELTLFNLYDHLHGAPATYTHTEPPPYPHTPTWGDTLDESEG
jgi:hypothetical protein